ncbi:hypothetical protein MHW47_04270 [Streptomyces sp. OfavH-34-F]|uniref:hypothetical protein n=1 Tax=Streptomyces sp. OfavH-34-F TaxID=2917760 RepID=UPI001EF183CD|nr:hypothetical protein [Streptomyces sp. OfavH-34-F]MCG7523663.1 hypothetical protein [Streptomyces sp. OfavH-34-F]
MTTEQSDIPLDLTAIEAALGRMVYRAGNLEAAVRYVGGRLAITPKELRKLDGVPAGRLVNEAKGLVEKAAVDERISEAERDELVKLLDDVGGHLEGRNTYIHGVWLTKANGEPFVMLSQKDWQVKTRPLAPEEIGKLSDVLLALSNDIFDWTVRVLGEEGETGS